MAAFSSSLSCYFGTAVAMGANNLLAYQPNSPPFDEMPIETSEELLDRTSQRELRTKQPDRGKRPVMR